jgi:microcystin-dependent protein
MEPYVGEIRMFGGNFAPAGWAFCDGSLLSIAENETLFQLIGTTYGGDGQETFALPDLRGRIPIHEGNGHVMGEAAGVESVTLTTLQLPAHGHAVLAAQGLALDANPGGRLLAETRGTDLYFEGAPGAPLAPAAMTPAGGSQPHQNLMPYLCVNFIISLFGTFPTSSGGELWEPFVAELRIFPYNFAPSGWALCNGQLLPISQNTALFSLLGTTYGGDGKSTFALPNLQGRAAMQQGDGPGLSIRDLGEEGGSESVTLLDSEMPAHAHALRGRNDVGETPAPTGAALARSRGAYRVDASQGLVPMAEGAITPSGGNLPHENQQPYLILDFCIALQGVFPPRS